MQKGNILTGNRRQAATRAMCALAWLFIVAMFSYRVYQFWYFTVDDAFITLRHARNLVHGYGFVYNPGGPPVESYTSTLLLAFQAAGLALGLNALTLTKIIGTAGAALAIAGSIGLARTLVRIGNVESAQLQSISPLVYFSGAFVLSYSPILAIGSVSGLETSLFTGILTLACWQSIITCAREERSSRLRALFAGLLWGLAVWTRPEAIAYLLGLGLMLFIPARQSRRRVQACFLCFGIGLAFYFALLTFRLTIFGRFQPNTYYAKMGTPLLERAFNGLHYCRNWALHNGGFELLALSLAGVFLTAPEYRLASLACLVLVAGQLAIVIYEGGDWMPHLRMLAPMLGLLAGLVSLGVAGISLRFRARWKLALSLLLPVLLAGGEYLTTRAEFRKAFLEVQTRLYGWNDAHRPVGIWLGKWNAKRMRSGKPRLTVALMDIGNVGWYSNANVIDFAGLADPEWAMQMYHARGLHFYPASRLLTQQRPDVIVLVSLSMPDAQPQVWWPGAEVQIFASPVFHQEYQRVAIIAHKDFPEDPNFLHVYVRRDESGEAPPLIPPRSRARR